LQTGEPQLLAQGLELIVLQVHGSASSGSS
jgi:hypothetical protein